MNASVIQYYGQQKSNCGYCKGQKCSVAHGMHAYKMLPQDYQDLIDRGWRRSGDYCYKPHNETTCCPCYTIKCNALDFKLSKSHKKILKRMSRFLRDGKRDAADAANGDNNAAAAASTDGAGICEEPKEPQLALHDIDYAAVEASNQERQTAENAKKPTANVDTQLIAVQITDTAASSLTASEASVGGSRQSFDAAKPPCKKAKQMRLERRQAKLAAKGVDANSTTQQQPPPTPQTNANQAKTLDAYFAEAKPSDRHQLNLQLVPVRSDQFDETQSSTYALYQRYQTRIHNEPPENVAEYLCFLQHSPLKTTKTVDGPASGYGSFHQQYWLDEKLIAVAVIDILPYCVSSVYFFYDPDYSFLSLGTYASLREIHFVQELAAIVPTLKYYYMGYYIHSCPKMRYKGKLTASYLLCPETYTWHSLSDDIRTKLDQHKYQRLTIDANATDADYFAEHDLNKVLLLLARTNQCVTYRQYIQSVNIETIDNVLDMIRSRMYKEITGDDGERVTILEYGRLVGKKCALRMLSVI